VPGGFGSWCGFGVRQQLLIFDSDEIVFVFLLLQQHPISINSSIYGGCAPECMLCYQHTYLVLSVSVADASLSTKQMVPPIAVFVLSFNSSVLNMWKLE